ncbi:MAG: hypothetical protein QME12_05165 [Nanoarchaeota archaeon]|nr:hypothetical protein [Nanoarchaeota archaeon]
MKRFPQKDLHFDEKELKTDLGTNNYIFVGSSTDMFAENVSSEWIKRVLEYCFKFNNRYLFQSKNPLRFQEFLTHFVGKDVVLATTIETDKEDIKLSNAPPYYSRAFAMRNIKDCGYNTMITIEPIVDFNEELFTELISFAKPTYIAIGSDSGNNLLPEPGKDKVLALLDKLKDIVPKENLKIKDNLRRIL